MILFVSSGLSIFLVLVSHSLFRHKLEIISLIKNFIKLIVRVLCYARKHKYPENRSALTYWEEEAPSRLDLGKGKYGGPFTEEEIEYVKTFFNMLPLIIALVAQALSDDSYWSAINRFTFTLLSCLCSNWNISLYVHFQCLFLQVYSQYAVQNMFWACTCIDYCPY